MENTPFIDYMAPECRAMVAARSRRDWRARMSLTCMKLKCLHKDGTVIDVELSAGVIHYRGKPRRCRIVRDITERKRAKQR